MFTLITAVILSVVCSAVVNGQVQNNNPFCRDFHPQMIVNFDQILGRWYATEVIFHDKEEIDKIKYHNVCPIIHLSDVLNPVEEFVENNNKNEEDDRDWDEVMKPVVKLWQENQNVTKRRWTSTLQNEELNKFKTQTLQNLRIIWNEMGTRYEYSLKYNISRPGYWMSFGSPNATIREQHQFIGTVQVLRAVRTHMVLTFCHISYRDQFFSVVLTRQPWMEPRELHNIHNFLQRKLPIKHVRRMCMDFVQNSANFISQNNFLFIFIVIFIVTYS